MSEPRPNGPLNWILTHVGIVVDAGDDFISRPFWLGCWKMRIEKFNAFFGKRKTMTKRVQEPYFTYLTQPTAKPLKTKEGRVCETAAKRLSRGPKACDGDWTEAMVGRVITNGKESARVRFIAVRWYDCGDLAASIRATLQAEGVVEMLPDLDNSQLEEGVRRYLAFNRDKGPGKTKIGAFDVQLL